MSPSAIVKEILKATLPEYALFHLSAYDHYFHGEPELRILRWLCNSDKSSLDVGANIGSYSYFMRRYSQHVYAYEPIPELAERLSRLLPGVTVRCAAVSDAPGTLNLQIPIWSGREVSALASVSLRYDQWNEVRQLSVPALRLDDENIGNIGFIKIDVEQHELSVLRGAIGKIRQHRPAILTETNALIYPKELPDMFEFITTESYNAFFKFQGNFLPFSKFQSDKHAKKENFGGKQFVESNIILLPEEKDASFLRCC